MKKAIFLFSLFVIGSQCFALISGWMYEVSGHMGITLYRNEEGELVVRNPGFPFKMDLTGKKVIEIEPGTIPPINPCWEIYAQFAYNHLTFEDESVGNSFIFNANLDLRFGLLLKERFYPFLGLGPGYYRVGITESSEFGINGMAGVGFYLTPRLKLDLGADMHYLFDKSNTSFLQTTAGAAYQFGGQ